MQKYRCAHTVWCRARAIIDQNFCWHSRRVQSRALLELHTNSVSFRNHKPQTRKKLFYKKYPWYFHVYIFIVLKNFHFVALLSKISSGPSSSVCDVNLAINWNIAIPPQRSHRRRYRFRNSIRPEIRPTGRMLIPSLASASRDSTSRLTSARDRQSRRNRARSQLDRARSSRGKRDVTWREVYWNSPSDISRRIEIPYARRISRKRGGKGGRRRGEEGGKIYTHLLPRSALMIARSILALRLRSRRTITHRRGISTPRIDDNSIAVRRVKNSILASVDANARVLSFALIVSRDCGKSVGNVIRSAAPMISYLIPRIRLISYRLAISGEIAISLTARDLCHIVRQHWPIDLANTSSARRLRTARRRGGDYRERSFDRCVKPGKSALLPFSANFYSLRLVHWAAWIIGSAMQKRRLSLPRSVYALIKATTTGERRFYEKGKRWRERHVCAPLQYHIRDYGSHKMLVPQECSIYFPYPRDCDEM